MFYSSNIKLVTCIIVAFLMTFIACVKQNPSQIPPSKLIKKHPEFTKENVLRIQKGMTEEDVEKIFGKPDDIDVKLCGPVDDQWQCLIYNYHIVGLIENNFYFSLSHSQPKLNRWVIHQVYQD